MIESQPETELTEELNGDTAILEALARKREPAEEGAEAEEEQVEASEPEESEEEAPPEVEEDPEIDLGDVKAKKSEILAWKAGQMKEADYRRKTAEVAEAKREAQAQQERVTQERTHYANQLDVLIGQLQTELVGDQQVLAQLAVEDPIEWVRQNATMQAKIQRFQQAVSERQVIEQRQTQEQERKRNDWLKEQQKALEDKLPEWRDEKLRAKELGEMEAFLRDQGYSDGDMAAFMDHRIYLIAREAMLAKRQATARATAKEKQVKPTPPKALKPGPATNNQAESDEYKTLQRKAKSGREEDLLALMAYKRTRNV